MNCSQAMELLTDSLTAPLPQQAAADLAAHLAACETCRAEAEALRRIWGELERLPEEQPGDEVRQHFAALLGPEVRRQEARTRAFRSLAAWFGTVEDRLAGWLPRRPLAQVATAAAALAIGVWIGGGGLRAGLPSRTAQGGAAAGSGGEIGELRQEVRSLSQLVTLSLLKETSASDRLRGVSFGGRTGGDDERVVSALLDTLSRDSDVNVRLAAVDALAPTVGRPMVRDQMLEVVRRESSPIVQIALIDVLLAHDRPGSLSKLAALAADPALDPSVRDYLRSRLGPTS